MRFFLLFCLVFNLSLRAVTITNSADIQPALNALLTNKDINIYLPAGTYYLSAPLMVPSKGAPTNPVLSDTASYHIFGDAMDATKLVWTNTNIGMALTSPIGYWGVTIENIDFIGPRMSNIKDTNTSIGLAIGAPGRSYGWSGHNQTIRNCAFIGWNYGACVTNQWGIRFENCVVCSNNIEGLRFAGSHAVNVSDCRISGGWSTCVGIGVGFHIPMNAGWGDNAQIANCLFSNCTNGIYNVELNLVCLNDHLERCGSYFTSLGPNGVVFNTIIGGYILDLQQPQPWNDGFVGLMLLDSGAAAHTLIENFLFQSASPTPRPIFNEKGLAYISPIYIGAGRLEGRFNDTSKVLVYSVGKELVAHNNLNQ